MGEKRRGAIPVIVAHLDCSSGISGDKLLGALLDVGTQLEKFTADDLSKLAAALAPEAEVRVGKTSSYGIAATTLCVGTGEARPEDQHNHSHERSWSSIRSNIENLSEDLLPQAAREKALFVFSELARVEAQIHSTTPDDVHFHEIGAVDSIVDIVGACAALDALDIEQLYATPPALGSGTVDTQHGILPVPAPATAALLLGTPTSMSSAAGELTTPTGAALLKLAAGFGPTPPLTPFAIGYGAGTRDIGQPNICRILVGQLDEAAQKMMGHEPKEGSGGNTGRGLREEKTVLLETNIDHIAPEAVAFAGEQLLAEGALDVWVTPIAMKKSRAALTLSVLSSKSEAEHFAARMMKLTGTLGVRVSIQPRYIAERESMTVDTKWGSVQVKVGSGRVRPEHEDIARIAREHNLDYAEVLEEISVIAEGT
ncbi:MAG: nickel pincer cofactor biosynthesis protein LarC [Coriobacteriia bacterium]|nr:nickel pincer cofactor biosynthesis protein LarC [Coriobacteriia bacterium]